MVDGALPGRGSSLAHAEVIAGVPGLQREGGAQEGVPGEAGFLSSVLGPEGLNQPTGASWPIP